MSSSDINTRQVVDVSGLGRRLIQMREVLSLKQVDLSNALGVAQSAISYAESGRNLLKLENLAALSGCYGVSLDWLVSGRGEMFTEPRQLQGVLAPSVQVAFAKSTPPPKPQPGWDTTEIPMNDGLFAEVITALDEGMKKLDLTVDPDRRITLTMTLYRMAVGLGRPVHPAILRNLLLLCPVSSSISKDAEKQPP